MVEERKKRAMREVASDCVASCLGADARLPIFRTGGLFYLFLFYMRAELGFFSG